MCCLEEVERISFIQENRKFREIVGMSLGEYLDAPTKSQKSMIVNKIVNDAIKQGARFLEQVSSSKSWRDVGIKRLRDKVRAHNCDFGPQHEVSCYSHSCLLKVKRQILISGRLVMH
jgi:hypothetical protein